MTGIHRPNRPLAIYAVVFALFLYLPIFLIVIFSFNTGFYVKFPLQGFTLDWYADLFRRVVQGGNAVGKGVLAGHVRAQGNHGRILCALDNGCLDSAHIAQAVIAVAGGELRGHEFGRIATFGNLGNRLLTRGIKAAIAIPMRRRSYVCFEKWRCWPEKDSLEL